MAIDAVLQVAIPNQLNSAVHSGKRGEQMHIHSKLPASTQMQHRLNLMYQQLRYTNERFPYKSNHSFSQAVLTATDAEAELEYWETLAQRR